MLTKQNICRECNKEFESYEFILRHIKMHKIKAKDYVLKWEHNGKIPLCACGCLKETSWNIGIKNFTKFIHGHHCVGKVLSEETKKKIGKKNSKNMKRYIASNPDVAMKKIRQMNAANQTQEVKKKRAESVHRFWSTSPFADKLRKEASDRAVVLLSQGKIGMNAPYKRAAVYNPFTQQEELMHSSWEQAFLETCIARQYAVTKDHGISISYIHPDGTQRQYIPDFYSFEDRTLYEIKGMQSDVDICKWSAAKEYCDSKGWSFIILMSEEEIADITD
jgi:hypothetical protein